MKRQTDPRPGAPNRCCHATTPTASPSPLTTTVWWPMLGLILSATLARHLGLPQLVDRHLDLRDAPGRANTGDKMMTLVASAPRFRGGRVWRSATALTTPRFCAPAGRLAPSAAWSRRRPPPAFARAGSGDVPAQLPVGPRPPTGPGEPGAAGPGLGRRRRTRRRAADHRPGLHHLRDLRAGQGGGATPWLHWQARLSPAAGRGRRNRRRADVSAARGPRQHRSGRRPLPAGDRGAGAPCWGQGATHGADRQRLLHPRRGRRLSQDEGPLLHHHPPACQPAQSH